MIGKVEVAPARSIIPSDYNRRHWQDYFLGTYYFDTGKFHADMAGLTHFDRNNHSFSAYRFHDEDPIFFQDGLRLTCRCGETEHGDTAATEGYLNPPPTRYTTYTWVYHW